MRTILIVMAVVLFAAWVLGKFFFQTGAFIHIFFIAAAIFTMQAVIINPKPQAEV